MRKKGFKKWGSLISAIAMVLSCLTGIMPINACAEVIAPQETAIGGGEIEKFVDFESAKEFGGDYTTQTDSGNTVHGKVLELVPSDGQVFGQLNLTSLEEKLDTDMYVLSFDFMAPQTDHIFKMIFRDTAGKDISSAYFEQNGKVVISQNGQTPYNLAKGAKYDGSLGFKEVGYYDAGGWHNLTVEVRPNGGGRNVDMKWYYDGEFVMDADTSNVNIDSLKNASGILGNIYIGSTKSGMSVASGETLDYDGSEKLYFDNFCISTYPEKYFYAKSSGSGNNVTINFTEGLSSDANLSKTVMRNTETGEIVGVSDVKSDISSVTLKTSESLKAAVEYCVEFDDSVKSCMDRTLLTDVYFITAAAENFEADKLVYDGTTDKYENKTSTFEVKTNVSGYSGASFIVNMYVTVQNPKSNAFYLYLKNNSGDLLLSGKTCDDLGDFATYKKSAPWLDTAEVKNDASNYFHAVDAFSSGTKRKVTYTIDAENRIIGFYIDDVFIGERALSASESAKSLIPGNIYVGINANYSDNTSVNVENVTVYTVKSSKKPVKFRTFNRNGSECEPFTEKTLATAKYARLYFNCDVDSDSITAESFVIKNSAGEKIGYTIGDYNTSERYVEAVFDSFLTRGEEYTVSASGITSNGAAIADYSTVFYVNEESDFYISNIKLVSGSEISDPTTVTGSVYPDAVMVNTYNDSKQVKVLLFAEKDGQIKAVSEETVTALANSDTYFTNSQSIDVSAADYIKAVFLDAATEVPYDNEICIGTRTAGTDANKDGFYNSFESTYSEKSKLRFFAKVCLPGDGEEAASSPVAYFSGAADENGKVAFDFRINDEDPSGQYKVLGVFSDGTTFEENINISNPTEADRLTAEIIKSVKEDDENTAVAKIKEIIEKRAYAMSLELEDLTEIDTDAAAEIVYNRLNSTSTADVSTEDMKFILNKAVYIEGIRSGLIANIYDISNQLALEETRINQFKDYSFNTETFAKSVTAAIDKSYSIKSFKDFENALYEQFVLNVVKNPDGTDNLKNVMNEFKDEIGINANLSSDVYAAIKNNSYSSYSELKSAVDKAVSNNSGGSSSSGGSGGGGSSAGIRNVTVSTDVSEDNKAQEINKDIFDDIEDVEWAKEAIVYLAERKIINGVGNGKFAPNDYVTRAEMAKMISGVFLTEFDGGENSFENPFNDVSEDDWSFEFIKKAYAAGIINGYDDGSFGPDLEITRQDAAVMLYRAAKKFNIEFYAELTKSFADEEEFSDYASEAILNMYNMGFINGVGDNKYAPNEKTTRAQTAKIIYAMIQM